MERKQRLSGIMAAVGLLVMILDSKLALEGARSGLELCIKTVIPSLFPFFVLSMMLTTALGGHVSYPLEVIAKSLSMPSSAASALIPSVLGGYPVGAKCVGDLYQRNQIRKKEAERMLAFCSNAGPSFLFGMVSGFFPERKMIWMLWGIHICSAVLSAVSIPAKKTDAHGHQKEKESKEESLILSAAKAMCLVCCWVILFRTVISFLNGWFLWMLPGWLQVFLMGMLELTNGCCELTAVTDVGLRFILCACMLSFGGLCVLFQTASVTKGLSLEYYIKGKLLQTVFSFLLSCFVVAEKGLYFAIIALLLPVILRKMQKRYSNPGALPV